MKAKKLSALLLAAVMIFSLAACGSKTPKTDPNATRIFTDSTGREVEVPAQIDKVALSGPLAQIVLFALCPDKLVGVSNAWSSEAQEFLDEKYFNMPQIGQLYGGKGECTKGMPVCSCRTSISSTMLPLGSPTSMTTSGAAASSVSRFSSPLPPYSWPSSGRLRYFSSKYACAVSSQALDTPTNLSGAMANTTIWASGPDTATFRTSAGTVTWRPQESVNTRVAGSCTSLRPDHLSDG